MERHATDPMTASCRGCGARFRVTASASWRVTRLVACPSCSTPIEIRPPSRPEDPGWRKVGHANVFGRTARASRAATLPRQRTRPEGAPRFDFEDAGALAPEPEPAREAPPELHAEPQVELGAEPTSTPPPIPPSAAPSREVDAEPMREVDEDISRLLELAESLRAGAPPQRPPVTPEPAAPGASRPLALPLPTPSRPPVVDVDFEPSEPSEDDDVAHDPAPATPAPEPDTPDAADAADASRSDDAILLVDLAEPSDAPTPPRRGEPSPRPVRPPADELEAAPARAPEPDPLAAADEATDEDTPGEAAQDAGAERVRVEDPLARPAPARPLRFVWVFGVLASAAAAFALGRGVERAATPEPPAEPVAQPVAPPDPVVLTVPIEQARQGAVFAARYAVSFAAISSDPSDPDAQRRAIDALLQDGHAAAAARIARASWVDDPVDPDRTVLLVDTLAAAGHHDLARRLALHGLAAHPAHAELTRAFNASIRDDPYLHVTPRTLAVDLPVDRIRKLGGGKSISFRLDQGDETAYAFKPSQREWELGWRAEVAAWALCEALPCGFRVPLNLPARISREDFERLYSMDEAKQRAYAAARFDALEWVREPGPDGVERDYLYGTAKVWTPGFVDWPIEYTDLWEPWLSNASSPRLLEQPVTQALWGLRQKPNGMRRWRILTRRAADVPTRELARQLSNVLSFDYLTNNWDRFSTAEDFYGVNNQFLDGAFLSLDNGAAFHTLKRLDVRQRFRLVERFDAHLVRALRALDRDAISAALFPDPSEEADTRLRVFWEQRASYLERVDALVEARGERAALPFDAAPTPGELLAELAALSID
jgi:hypothetical protein